jgi:hypothetical protein
MISEKEDSRQNNTREVRLGSNESPSVRVRRLLKQENSKQSKLTNA